MTFLALATCGDLPDWEVDDAPFHSALEASGVRFKRPVWDDPGVDWGQFDAVLIRTTWDYQLKQPAYKRWIESTAAKTRVLNPPDVVVWNTEKTYLRDLEEVGAPLTPTVWLKKGGDVDLLTLMNSRGWTEGFLKPVIGATARETLPFDLTPSKLVLANAHLKRLLPGESMMLQPFCRSVLEEGEYSAVFFEGKFSHGVQKIPVPGDYRVQDDFGATDRPHRFSSEDYERVLVIEGALSSLLKERFDRKSLLYSRIDLLRGEDGMLSLNELELVEPSLFFRHDATAAMRLVRGVLRSLSEESDPRDFKGA